MIKYLNKRFSKFIGNKVKPLKEAQQLNFDYHQISQLFKESSFIPYTGWSMSPSTILHILNDIVINKRRKIIEFGSGTSTYYIARLLKSFDLSAEFYTIESDEEWAKELNRQLNILGIADYVNYLYSHNKYSSGKFFI